MEVSSSELQKFEVIWKQYDELAADIRSRADDVSHALQNMHQITPEARLKKAFKDLGKVIQPSQFQTVLVELIKLSNQIDSQGKFTYTLPNPVNFVSSLKNFEEAFESIIITQGTKTADQLLSMKNQLTDLRSRINRSYTTQDCALPTFRFSATKKHPTIVLSCDDTLAATANNNGLFYALGNQCVQKIGRTTWWIKI